MTDFSRDIHMHYADTGLLSTASICQWRVQALALKEYAKSVAMPDIVPGDQTWLRFVCSFCADLCMSGFVELGLIPSVTC